MSEIQLSLGAQEYLVSDFEKKECMKCGSQFWSRGYDETCGDAPCVPYSFISSPVLKKRSLDEMRDFYLAFFEHHGHKRIAPYPVIARWRQDVLLVNASIYDFQPLVTSGLVPPPANPLTISQPCIRLNDIAAVGKSGRHLTNFEMMAHHAFNYPDCEIYWKNETIKYCDVLLQELGADPGAITYKESPWAGGGNAGTALEVLLGGLELATLVFMDLERSDSGITIKGEHYQRMENSIVDTGYGLERFVWASNGAPTIYDAVMPDVVNALMIEAGIEHSLEDPFYANILAQNARLAGLMDIKGSNLLSLRKRVAQTIGISVDELVKIVEPVEAVYTLADHSRCLMFMLGDGIVPSNAKAGYLARLVIRKALRLAETINLQVGLEDIVRMQINTQKAYPQYEKSLDTIIDIIQHEARKYKSTIDKGKRLVKVLAKEYMGRVIPLDELIRLYETHGVPPEISATTAKQEGTGVDFPDDFYSLVAKTHDQLVIQEEVEEERLPELPPTYRMFYDEPEQTKFKAKIVGVVNHYLVLDKTLFYPEGGGQPEDTGYIISSSLKKVKMEDARLIGDVVLHKVSTTAPFRVGDIVQGEIDDDRRFAHARHHTATHILLSAIKRVLGDHIWQEGAQKGENRSRLDVSHYKRVTVEEQNAIEREANKIVMKDIPVETAWVDRNEAEQTYGFVLYQGGVPPGEIIRVVKVGTDVQACAGTHMTRTGKVGPIRIIKTEGIQDGVQRFEFAAGIAAISYDQDRDKLISDTSQILRVPYDKLPATVERFFTEWKKLQKENDDLKKKNAQLRSAIIKAPTATESETGVSPDIMIGEDKAIVIDNIEIMISYRKIADADIKELLKTSRELLTDDNVLILGGTHGGRANVVVAAGKNVVEKGFKSSEVVKEPSVILGGGGGGRPERAQGGGQNTDKIDEALELAMKLTSEQLYSLKRES
jgi:alanyl-tRNA synthetase